jgi:hypothetical protein
MTMTFKTTAENGWSAYTVCEAIEPPESGAGYHRHPTYDETFLHSEPANGPLGRYAAFVDPFGNVLEISEPGS